MHKLYHIRGLTNRERNFWDSFPVDLAETKETLKCTMIYERFTQMQQEEIITDDL